MHQSAAQIGREKPLTPSRAPRSEDDARALFIQYRFAENGGKPFCPDCGCDAIYTYKKRGIYKCVSCTKQFSPTSGTPWASRKLSYVDIVYIIAKFCHEAEALSAHSLSEDLGIQYKTAFSWLHKLRSAMAKVNAEIMLSGEVEIDGCQLGGFVRPKNTKKTATDHRKVPYRATDRQRVVIAARQRGVGGPVRTFVGEREGHAKLQIVSAVSRETVLFSDKAAHWNELTLFNKLLQVNHKETYCSPEACTNAVESFFGRLRKAESKYRHITQNYLDLYTAEAAFRATYSGKRKGDRVSALVSAMSRPGRSEIAGYFQGRKRACRIANPDGTYGEWRPPTRAERDRARKQDGRGVTPGPLRPRRTAENWMSGFNYISAAEFLANPTKVVDQPGVYTLLVANGGQLLERCGYSHVGRPLTNHQGHDHLYTGESYGVRTRLMEHLLGGFERSPIREGLLALHVRYGILDEVVGLCTRRDETEAALDQWMRQNVLVGFRQSPRVKAYETDILRWAASPLNSQRAEPEPFLDLLKAAKAQLRDVTQRWETAPKLDHHRRRR